MITLLSIPVLAAALAQPGTPPEPSARVLLDRSLTERPVHLVAITESAVQVIDAAGQQQAIPRDQVLAILPPLPPLDPPIITGVVQPPPRPMRGSEVRPEQRPPSPPAGRLELTDAQVLPGALAPTPAGKPDVVLWSSRLFGAIEVSLENIAALVIDPGLFDAADPIDPAEDTVLLINGDRISGFVESIGEQVKVEKNGATTPVPLARVTGIRLANPVRSGDGAWVWTADTAAAVSQLTFTSGGTCTISGRIPGASAQPSATIPAEAVVGLCFEAGLVEALAALPMTNIGPTDPARLWTPPPQFGPRSVPLGAADIELPGPMRVSWTLPPNASRVSATLELPPSARLWGDCEVVIESVDAAGQASPIARERLNQSSPTASVNAPLSGASQLRITIDQGPSGPIQDRVVLRRALVLAPSAP